ncbi:phospholipase D-like domain-containing protein [Draconibacterium sediminis]|uniref:Phospholipase D-like domain-containing protein n=1 Tax=Draconibacterium sediminis TaxID=1544798 RepID=A0A0D8JB88_9BACT|nr:phospholipase D-like domain-containing protein [Draconibacterium sediminis]KJF44235.1 hypothetical protein LH29_01555 [Draconibacterium sediminis]
MRILQPHRISSEIFDVIYQARDSLVIVSPYVNFNNWRQMADALKHALKRGVKIDFFVRNDPDNANSWEQVEQLGLTPNLVENLHAKFYYNERTGVISSMNLLSFSNSNSIEIGCKLETNEELDELKNFVNDFLQINKVSEKPSEEYLYLSREKFTVVLANFLESLTNSSTSVYFQKGSLIIYALSNKFFLDIDKTNNSLFVSAIISRDEASCFTSYSFSQPVTSGFNLTLIRGEANYYDLIQANYKCRLSTIYLDNLKVQEKINLMGSIHNLIEDVVTFKKYVYQQN